MPETESSMLRPAVIVNADDFGASSTINEAVVRSFQEGWVSSTTVMANGEAFEEACALAHEHGFARCVGIHFVLTAGRPLTVQILRQPRLCSKDGQFRIRRKGHLIWLTADENRCVGIELKAQIARCRRFGLPLTHFDSHNHIHEEIGVLRVAVNVLGDEGINRIRIVRNLLPRRAMSRSIYVACLNRYISACGLALTGRFGSAQDFSQVVQRGALQPKTDVEVMVHPDLSIVGSVIDRTDGTLMASAVKPVLALCSLATVVHVISAAVE